MTHPKQSPDTTATPFHPSAGILVSGLPLSLIEQGIQDGLLSVRTACGARVIRKSELQAFALSKKAELRGCDRCGD